MVEALPSNSFQFLPPGTVCINAICRRVNVQVRDGLLCLGGEVNDNMEGVEDFLGCGVGQVQVAKGVANNCTHFIRAEPVDNESRDGVLVGVGKPLDKADVVVETKLVREEVNSNALGGKGLLCNKGGRDANRDITDSEGYGRSGVHVIHPSMR